MPAPASGYSMLHSNHMWPLLRPADPDLVLLEMEGACGLSDPDTALRVSAKTGQGLPSVLPTIIE